MPAALACGDVMGQRLSEVSAHSWVSSSSFVVVLSEGPLLNFGRENLATFHLKLGAETENSSLKIDAKYKQFGRGFGNI